MDNVLIVDDDIEIEKLIKASLPGFSLHFAENLARARDILQFEKIDLILLDVSLPDGDGFHFFMDLQNSSHFTEIPVIFLTSRDQPNDKVTGLSLGADDYITKPFNRLELKARVALRIDKSKKLRTNNRFLQKQGLFLDVGKQQVQIELNRTRYPIDLTGLEFRLLLFFAENENQVLSRQTLLDSVWGTEMNVIDRTIDAHVSNLRKKIKTSAYSIQSVYGEGYRFTLRKTSNIHKAS